VPFYASVLLLISCSLIAWTQTAPAQPDNSTDSTSSASIAPVQTTITVTEKVVTETPASTIVLGQKQLQQTPGVNLDDRLRQVPGFSLFRRSSSLVANPTTQGVSLRATGSTGASRTLVLWDDVPLNDPFGGWVYWTRINPFFIDRVELVRGANTAIFGDKAMGGTVQLFSTPPQREHLNLSYFGGNENTHELAGGYSNLWGPFGASADVRAFTTDGYFITPETVRGSVDDRANVRFVTGTLHLDYLGANNRLALRFDTLAEERHNGTALQNNSTGLGTLSANYAHSWEHDQFAFVGFHTREQFHSTFSAVSASRNFERLTSQQTVPAEDLGGAAYWQHHASVWNTVFGADVDDTHGTSNDFSYSTLMLNRSGGTLLQHGVFGQGDVKLGPARFYAGLRHQFTGQGDTFLSPNGGVTVGLRQFRLRASGYRSFRSPTLNELYRDFRVGNALTKANAALRPEALVGVEIGFDWVGERDRLSLTLFHDDLSQLIGNATLSITPTLILRQRRNFASGLSRGIESSFNHRWRNWSADLGYLYADARLSTGPRLAQVPKQQGTGSLTYSADRTLVSFGVRSFGLQFDDDLNQFKLPGYAALQLTAQQRLKRGLYAQAAVENLLDRQYLVALTPTPNTGAPRLWRIGLRWDGAIR
jgi:outer membrane cobalamin receptor